MSEAIKRKEVPDGTKDSRGNKRSKGGSGGKWQTPHQKQKAAHRGGGKFEAGDVGIWATCVKGKEGAATQELKAIFDEYAEQFYGVIASAVGDDEGEEGDIESSIRKEIDSMSKKKIPTALFTPIYLDLQCVLFFKTIPPVVPVEFVRRICEDARNNPQKRKTRFANRLTPMTMMGKATDRGLEEVGKAVLREHFQLAEDSDSKVKPFSYAIRPTIRNHNTFKRDTVIKFVASLISSHHKVDLTKPEKVIIVEIYQTICGMSVVGDDWESLKRYNLAEIYQPTQKPNAEIRLEADTEATPNSVTTDEAKAQPPEATATSD